jgi:PAS domain S-box-containing protein
MEQLRTPEIVELITRLGNRLQASADVAALQGDIADLLVTTLADAAVLAVHTPQGHRSVVVRHRDPELEARMKTWVGSDERLISELARARSLRSKRPWPAWVRRVSPGAIRSFAPVGDAGRLAKQLAALDVSSIIVLEIADGGTELGWLAVARGAVRAPFTTEEFSGIGVFAQKAAQSILGAQFEDQRRAEAEAQRRAEAEQRRWAHMFAHAGWGAAVIDAATRRVQTVNPAFARMHGFPDVDAVQGREFDEIFRPPRGDEPVALPREDHVSYETVHHRADTGAAVPVLVDLSAVPGGNDGARYCAAYVQDLTQLKRAEHRVRELERLEAIGRLAGGVAHEVNNMLTIAIGFSDLLLGMPELPPSARDELRQIRQAADHAAGVSRQLLAFGRRQVLHPAPLELNEVVRGAARLLAPLLPRDIEVQTRLGVAGNQGIHVDRGQMEQIIVNLALNARDAMPSGGVFELATDFRDVSADFGSRWVGFEIPPGRYAFLTARDTGSGIDLEVQAHLFEPFYTTKPLGKGTGLGLATTYGIVKQSGGYIWVDSRRDAGTTFTLCFPVIELEHTQRERRARARVGAGASVLVVDDEPAVRTVCMRLLRRHGYDAGEAASGADALAALEGLGGRARVVLTDLVMPDMSGPELRDRIAERWPEIHVLFMSGHPAPELVHRGLLQDGEPILQKPFSASELSTAVADAIGGRSSLSAGRGPG